MTDKIEPEGEWVEVGPGEYVGPGRRKFASEFEGGELIRTSYYLWVPKLEWPTEPGTEIVFRGRTSCVAIDAVVLPPGYRYYLTTKAGSLLLDTVKNNPDIELIEVKSK